MSEEELSRRGEGPAGPADSQGPSAQGAEGLEKVRAALNHDLRTPLTIVISYAQTLAQGKVGELNERQKEMLEVMVNECFRMDTLIRELVVILRDALEEKRGGC